MTFIWRQPIPNVELTVEYVSELLVANNIDLDATELAIMPGENYFVVQYRKGQLMTDGTTEQDLIRTLIFMKEHFFS